MEPENSATAPVAGDTFWRLLDGRINATPERLMLADEHDRRVTWAQFGRWAEHVAAGLHDLGIGEGSVVAWQLPSRIETVVISMALSRLGAVQVPIIHLYREREVRSVVRSTDASWYLYPGTWRGFDYDAMAVGIQAQLHDRSPLRLLDCSADLPEGDPDDLPPRPDDSDAIRWIYSTSGTASEPKGVLHTDGTLIAAGVGLAEALRPDAGCINSVPFPYAHIGGPDNLVMTLRLGIPTVMVETFSPPETFELFARLGVTHLGGSTAHYLALLGEERRLGRHPVPSLKTMCGGGAPKPAEVFWRVRERMGVTIRHGYGSTECPMISCGSVYDSDEQLANTDGAPILDCQISIVDSVEDLVPAGVDGDILVRGPMLARGYLDPVQHRDAFRSDGFFRTGDRGHLRADGHIVITGRTKELIIRKGENISPREVEDVLMTHPSVLAVAVVGLADPERGERVCAVVEMIAGAAPLSIQAIQEHCRAEGLMTQKIPEQLEIVDALPRNPTMKILKRVLVERLSSSLQPE